VAAAVTLRDVFLACLPRLRSCVLWPPLVPWLVQLTGLAHSLP
jgi:hypothetical protein